ncbi:unnamed protein product [Peniophora sp. CBMAI 1063]|nr:unnamed protein product [Peniophora sp. CBMAI 1063]
MSTANLPALYTYLQEEKTRAYVADQIEESQLMVPPFEKMENLTNTSYAQAHFQFQQDGNVNILVNRDGEVMESVFSMTGVLTGKSTMPYLTNRELTQIPAYGRFGHQYIALTAPGLSTIATIKHAISVVHVMASLICPEGSLRPLTDLFLDGEDAVLASAPLGTPAHHAHPDDTPLVLTQQQDPNGHVQQYCQQRGLLVLQDNQVDVFPGFAQGNVSHLRSRFVRMAAYLSTSAGMYDLHGGTSGALLRAGQIVRVEVGFRIVPVGQGKFALRMDLKSAAIMNDDVVAAMAFAEAATRINSARRTISVAGPGPSTILARVKRAKRNQAATEKDVADMDTLGDLPFPPAST